MVFNDPQGQPTHGRQWRSVLLRLILKSWDERTTRINIMIITGSVWVDLVDRFEVSYNSSQFVICKLINLNSCYYWKRFLTRKTRKNKTGVIINDPLGQTHSHASNEHCFLLFCFSRFEIGRTDGQHVRKQWSLPGSDFGLAEWIKKKVSSMPC